MHTTQNLQHILTQITDTKTEQKYTNTKLQNILTQNILTQIY